MTLIHNGNDYHCNHAPNGAAFVWDAVWQSKVSIVENGWVAELKIPYSAIRFSDQLEQTWGINFIRIIRRYREKSSWNLFDLSVDGFVNQFGELNGIEDIKSPIRLSVMPYLSAYMEHYPFNIEGKSNLSYSFNGGMDLKYGLSESFTLDMTIVPDFGQVRSDNEVLNLSPFEVKYDENRQFFTEGTELFNKGRLFYSRRIGGKPSEYYTLSEQLNEGEKIIDNPDESQLINASKISGRTLNGLGIGIFNAMTANTYATIEDSLGNTRIVLTEPFTNYNILVLDQSLKNKSYVSLINTNVSRQQGSRNANVTGTKFKIADRSNTYAVKGFGAISNVYSKADNNGTGTATLGHKYNVEFGKISGNFQFDLEQNVESDTYDPNDLGFLYNNNEISNVVRLKYNIYKPFWKLLKLHSFIGTDYNMLYKPRNFTEYGIFGMVNTTTLKYISGGVLITLNGGLAWTANTSFTERIGDVDFADANNGWIIGRDGTIYSTSNAGSSWTQQTSGTDVELFAVDFTDANIGHISGAETTLLNTYDGGSSWAVADTAGLPKLDYFDMFFINTSTGWTVGEAGTILTSADSGKTWSEQTSGTNVDLFSVSFVDANNGWISGGGGTILYTTDGGSTWNSQLSGSNQDILSISMRTASLGWYCGDNGTIGYYSLFPSSIIDNNAMLNYVSVYPNPASNKVTIDLSRFSENESSFALYDLAGNVILQRNKIKEPNVTLSNDGITPGMYILKIINNAGKMHTEKIIFN
ncbi:T9SS type A sorting domain-containing protein [Cytophagaceae bacterium AH-315-L13]|nr:T9SS type A sorting domain-containing protein [Cytophagaceae bacterium AH-315-L13]